jgi:hypothetical protein
VAVPPELVVVTFTAVVVVAIAVVVVFSVAVVVDVVVVSTPVVVVVTPPILQVAAILKIRTVANRAINIYCIFFITAPLIIYYY